MSFNSNSVVTLSDSDDERYEAQLARRCTKVETLLRQQEEKEYLERQACKEAKIVEQKRLEEETQKKEEEELWQRKEERQRNLAHCLKVNCVTTVEQRRHKNWAKSFLLPLSPPFDKEMNLIDLLPLTKRQRVRYLPKETLEACQQCKELAREMEMSVVSGGNPCERCTDFRILCISQNLL